MRRVDGKSARHRRASDPVFEKWNPDATALAERCHSQDPGDVVAGASVVVVGVGPTIDLTVREQSTGVGATIRDGRSARGIGRTDRRLVGVGRHVGWCEVHEAGDQQQQA